ncbi:MAG: MATE family efflux transporter, partial [Flavobacteriales bacterium]|nr:MATE family efflux transporter [Flavobacteriales bacterium]
MNTSISYKNIWKIAFPIIISGVAQNVVNVTDTMFLGQLSNVALGAGGNAGIFYFVLVISGMGFTTGAQIIIGRRNGEKNYSQIGKVFDHCLYFIIPLGFILFFFMKFISPHLLAAITLSPQILEASIEYLDYRAFGILFSFINFSFIAFYVGTTKTKILIPITFLMMLTNVFLDYSLIFGNFGFPEMGIKGAAIASVISEATALLFFIIYTYKKIDIEKFNLFGFRNFDKAIFNRILKVGSPIMLQNFLSLSSWFIFFMIIEKLGETELAVSHIIRSIYMVLMIPLFGFSSATNTLVSNLIGQGNSEKVLPLIKKIVILSLLSTTFVLLFNLFLPTEMIGFYTKDITIINAAIPTLNVVSGTMFFFAIAFILFNGVSGTGNTKTSLLIEVITISIYLVATYYIAIELKASLPIVWCSEFIYFGLLGLLSF